MKISLFDNWQLKLLAVLIAFTLWFYIVSQKSVKQTYTVPLKFVNMPKSFMKLDVSNQKVKLIVSGPKNVLLNQNVDRFIVPLDLANVSIGKNKIKIKKNSISIPNGLKISDIIPDKIELNIALKATKSLKIEPFISGLPNKNYEIKKVTTTPETVLVQGPEEKLKDIKVINTLPIEIDNATNSIKTEIKLKNIKDFSIVNSENISVAVNVIIEEKEIEKKFSNVPLKIIGEFKDKSVNLSPKNVILLLKGKINIVNTLNKNKLVGELNLKNKIDTIVPKFNLPEDIKIILISPPFIKAVVSE